jgi:hypothetical protein
MTSPPVPSPKRHTVGTHCRAPAEHQAFRAKLQAPRRSIRPPGRSLMGPGSVHFGHLDSDRTRRVL